MGFSVSGAAAIIFASMFIAFGMWFTATSASFDRVTEAQDLRTDDTLEASNTDINVSTAEYDTTSNRLTVQINNTGATEVSLNATDLLVDNQRRDGWAANATVEGISGTDLLLAGERATIEIDGISQPDRVKVVTSSGVSSAADVEVVT